MAISPTTEDWPHVPLIYKKDEVSVTLAVVHEPWSVCCFPASDTWKILFHINAVDSFKDKLHFCTNLCYFRLEMWFVMFHVGESRVSNAILYESGGHLRWFNDCSLANSGHIPHLNICKQLSKGWLVFVMQDVLCGRKLQEETGSRELWNCLLVSYLSVGSLKSLLLTALLLKQQTLKLRDKAEIELDHVSLWFQPCSSVTHVSKAQLSKVTGSCFAVFWNLWVRKEWNIFFCGKGYDFMTVVHFSYLLDEWFSR